MGFFVTFWRGFLFFAGDSIFARKFLRLENYELAQRLNYIIHSPPGIFRAVHVAPPPLFGGPSVASLSGVLIEAICQENDLLFLNLSI